MIPFGTKVTDNVTGYTGVVTARSEYMNGCKKVCLERLAQDGKLECEWFDVQRFGEVHNGGGPAPLPPRA